MKARKMMHTHLVNIAWSVEALSSIHMVINILNHRVKVMGIHMVLKIKCCVELLDPRFHSLKLSKRPGGLGILVCHIQGWDQHAPTKEKKNQNQ